MAYIRTIHTSFTAAHPNPWSRPAVAPLVNMHQPLYPSPQKYPTQPSPAPPASGAGGRRRAYAFRAPAAPHRPVCKFDPFGDEPTAPVPNLATLASLSAPPTPRLAAASLPPPVHHHQYAVQPHHLYQQKPSSYLPPRRQNRGGYYAGNNNGAFGNQQRPRHAPSSTFVEAPTEIWRSNSPSRRYEFEEYEGEGGSGVSSQPQVQVRRRMSPPPPLPAPVPAQVRRTPSPPAPIPAPVPTTQQNRFFHDKDAKAKLVAGILLNRVHAVGKPRRRVPSPVGGKKPYVPSGLSQVVACAA
ncbi:hypothetical protein MD484_g6655, partial [Candolleomyces efflorescens]